MEIQVENVAPDPTQATAKVPTEVTNPVEHLSIAERFNITTPSKEEDAKLKTIWGYMKQQGDERPRTEVIWEIINLEQTLGAPKLGETRLDKLYRYVSLRIQEARINEQLRDVTDSVNIYR